MTLEFDSDPNFENVDNLCRTCLCEVEINNYFRLEEYYHERSIQEILTNVASVQINANHNMPNKICNTCYNDVIKFDSFKCKVLQSEQLLSTIVPKHSLVKTENNVAEEEKVQSPNEQKLPKHITDSKESTNVKQEPTLRKGKRLPRRKEPCEVCGKLITSFKMKNHLRVHTDEKPFECIHCGIRFKEKSNLNRHVKTHGWDRPYKCNMCEKGFLRPSSLSMHLLTVHNDEKNICCPICGKAFKHQHFLNKHTNNVHNNASTATGETPQAEYTCPICGNSYMTKSSLNVHKLKHAQPRAFLCNVCGKGYSTKSILENHQRIHATEKEFGCDECGKKFRFLTTLKTHILMHSGEKPLSCHICQKTFRQHSHLNTHIRGQHSIMRAYQCSFCSKAFKYRSNLRVHVRIHTGETPYNCNLCDKGFYDSTGLKRHQKNHGADKIDDSSTWNRLE